MNTLGNLPGTVNSSAREQGPMNLSKEAIGPEGAQTIIAPLIRLIGNIGGILNTTSQRTEQESIALLRKVIAEGVFWDPEGVVAAVSRVDHGLIQTALSEMAVAGAVALARNEFPVESNALESNPCCAVAKALFALYSDSRGHRVIVAACVDRLLAPVAKFENLVRNLEDPRLPEYLQVMGALMLLCQAIDQSEAKKGVDWDCPLKRLLQRTIAKAPSFFLDLSIQESMGPRDWWQAAAFVVLCRLAKGTGNSSPVERAAQRNAIDALSAIGPLEQNIQPEGSYEGVAAKTLLEVASNTSRLLGERSRRRAAEYLTELLLYEDHPETQTRFIRSLFAENRTLVDTVIKAVLTQDSYSREPFLEELAVASGMPGARLEADAQGFWGENQDLVRDAAVAALLSLAPEGRRGGDHWLDPVGHILAFELRRPQPRLDMLARLIPALAEKDGDYKFGYIIFNAQAFSQLNSAIAAAGTDVQDRKFDKFFSALGTLLSEYNDQEILKVNPVLAESHFIELGKLRRLIESRTKATRSAGY